MKKNSSTPPTGLANYVVGTVWQLERYGQLTQVLFMQHVTATSPEHAYRLATELDQLDLAMQNRVGYTVSMRNCAWWTH